ncbi:MAG: hypothetical protein EAZ47_05305 [Bacteroidetes bacterium]|nr:MAG: hypothetical protein EAY72_08470 [Bacteroidota bacterium]TAF93868.1 MAG: hypothetical protein EAZ47_05305 [Bacteroidota bacterium]
MKKINLLLVIGFTCYFIGIVKIVHWQIFWSKNEIIRSKDYFTFIKTYRNDVSTILPNYHNNPLLLEIVCVILFSIAGMIFLRRREKIGYKVLAVSAFIFAFWHLFGLM